MSVLIEAAVDVTLLVLMAFAVMPLLRRQPAALRHWVLAAALFIGAALPAIEPAVPKWPLPMEITSPIGAPHSRNLARETASPASLSADQAAVPAASPPARDVVTVLLQIWSAGAVLGLGVLVLGFARLRHLAGNARVIGDPKTLEHVAAVQATLGLTRPVTLLESRDSCLPIVWGVLRPRVLLPANAREWPDARMRVVLTHELAHLARRDWIVQCGAELLRAFYWFNPLVWKACARLRLESDHACDDIVLSRGVDGCEYAAHLLDIARALRGQRNWTPAPAMAHTSGFERRVKAMLDAQINRRPLSRRAYAITLTVCLSLALPIAALTAQTALVSFTGSVLDPSNAVLPDAVITLTNTETQAKYEVRTNRDGRYEIPGLPAGRYLLESKVPGFETVKVNVTVGGQNIDRDLKLQLGTIQETITIVTGPVAPAKPMSPEQQARIEEIVRKRAAQACPEAPPATPAIGGNIRVPIKLRDRRPIYPPALASTGVSGKVELLAMIGTDGRVQDITVESASHSEFAAAAMDAVRQWEFDATLLNCVPVETRMMVTANFVHR